MPAEYRLLEDMVSTVRAQRMQRSVSTGAGGIKYESTVFWNRQSDVALDEEERDEIEEHAEDAEGEQP